jgi:hypothetical protein
MGTILQNKSTFCPIAQFRNSKNMRTMPPRGERAAGASASDGDDADADSDEDIMESDDSTDGENSMAVLFNLMDFAS